MSEVFFAFIGLGLITTLQFIVVVNRLYNLEEKINALKGDEE